MSWTYVGLCWAKLAYVGPGLDLQYVGSESFRSLFPIWFWPPGVAITTITIAPRGRSCQGGGSQFWVSGTFGLTWSWLVPGPALSSKNW